LQQLEPGESADKVLSRHGYKPNNFGMKRLYRNKASYVVVSSNDPLVHPYFRRFLTDTELCRLCSFPDQYEWADSNPNKIRARIGNSVPPLGMFHIAKHISNLLGYTANP
jgi:site-specific DNA-cytosine methylase